MSAKLEKLARKLNIDPATLPPIDGQSVTVNLTQQIQPGLMPVQPRPKEQRQSEYERLKMEFQFAKQRLQEFMTQDKQERIAARRARV
jgi:hypothetical protein